jgi:fumarate reductase flavoprotein subunit
MKSGKKELSIGRFLYTLFLMALISGCDNAVGPESVYTLHFTPGTYEASAVGYNQTTPITLRVTFSETAITNIVIISQAETAGEKSDATLDLIPKAIIQEQSLALDAVSGATARWTREGILKAVENCVKEAGGDEAVAKLKGTTAKALAIYLGY